MSKHPKFAVIGGGSWATAIAKMLCVNFSEIVWYMRNRSAIEHINIHKHNPNYLSAVTFDTKKLILTDNINMAIAYADYVIFAIPSAFLDAELKSLTVSIKEKIIFSAIKGIVPETELIIGSHFHKVYNIPYKNIGVIAGPCHAEEVALERLSYLTIAAGSEDKAVIMSKALSSSFIKTKISDDIIGTEYAAMLKNIYAIAAGIGHSLGYGDNFQSVLISNAIREMEKFISQKNNIDRNINDSAYLGDLLVTGYSLFSRNRTLGNMLGKGYSVKSAIKEMNMIAEGYYAARSAYLLSQELPYQFPIIDTVYYILYQEKDPREEFQKLTGRLN